MYVNALQPRQFEDSQGANQEINMSVGFEFLFERDDASQINKLSVKDLKDQISNIGKVEQNIAILFKMLQLSFQTQRRAQQFSGEGINFIQVEVNFFDIILTLESILLKQTGLKQQKQKTSQICGLPQNQYEKMIELVKDKSLDFIVILSKQMPAETLPYIPRMIAYINLTFQNKVKNGLKLDAYQHILRVLEQIAQVYGANLSQLVNSICFADNDYNINDLICEIFKLIVQKTDQTSIDLSDKSSTQKDLIKPNKMQRKDDNSSTPVIKTFQLQYLDSYTLEQNLISLLDFIISITQHSSLYMLLVQNEKVKLESVLFTILSFSQLKLIQNGIKYVVFDKDNTLTNAYEKDINPQIQDGYNQCKEVFGLQNMAILSNSVGSTDDKDHQEAKLLEQITGIPVIRHKLKKPLVKDDIYLHFNLPLSQQKSTSNQQSNSPIALIGDRILADTVMGNSHGFFTIDVRPFSTKNENIMVKMSRKVEEYVLPIVCRGKQAPEHQIFQHVKREDLIK